MLGEKMAKNNYCIAYQYYELKACAYDNSIKYYYFLIFVTGLKKTSGIITFVFFLFRITLVELVELGEFNQNQSSMTKGFCVSHLQSGVAV